MLLIFSVLWVFTFLDSGQRTEAELCTAVNVDKVLCQIVGSQTRIYTYWLLCTKSTNSLIIASYFPNYDEELKILSHTTSRSSQDPLASLRALLKQNYFKQRYISSPILSAYIDISVPTYICIVWSVPIWKLFFYFFFILGPLPVRSRQLVQGVPRLLP